MKANKLFIGLVGLTLALPTWAEQYIKGADRQNIEVTVSNSQQNVLAIQGRKIRSVVPSVAGSLDYQKDTDQGVLYFKLSDYYGTSGTISLFVNDDAGVRYKLILVPKAVGAEEVILIPPDDKSGQASTGKSPQSFMQQIKELVYVMGEDADEEQEELSISGIERVEVNKPIPLWKEAQLFLLRRYEANDLYGELYQITNLTTQNLNLLEQEFYRKKVVAVSVENLTVLPNQSTFVYVIKER